MSDRGYVDATDQYGYVPSIAMGAIFLAVFSLSGLAHVGQTIYSRRYWWMVCMWLGNLLEILGWGARLGAHWKPLDFNLYIMQICTLIIGPTFFSASLYWAGGLAIQNAARSKSWLSGAWFKTLFIAADIVSLVVQAVGGAKAAEGETDAEVRTGSDIMLAGIVIQLAVMIFYVLYMGIWAFKARREIETQGRRFQLMLLAFFLSSVGIIVRGCYRTPELVQGFDGHIAEQQSWMLFDAIPIAVSSIILNIFHPHWYLVYSVLPPSSQPSREALDPREAEELEMSLRTGGGLKAFFSSSSRASLTNEKREAQTGVQAV
ncbi:hypothetical protein Rhopal_001181-T1 [Rhodotorula paludigena]|uniref:Uncharacterized protein n=1 Tax=Rhodotorula paludigena TaxID=86838 RepID=A0AAV5G6N1_9BASI|nr:hypothetical protein Rhopal_001181-T1 [Rhodotorula paludigena]